MLCQLVFQLVFVFEYNNEINFVENCIINNDLQYVAFCEVKQS